MHVVVQARKLRFESSVISYGSQAYADTCYSVHGFESSVISYGSQAKDTMYNGFKRLRVV